MTPTPTETPLSIDVPGAARLFGVWHAPATPPRAAAVLCHPMFEEKKSAHLVLVDLARRLAAEGCAVLRFDFRGCGDSAGAADAIDPADWLTDVETALSVAAFRCPGKPLGLLGLRLGATLAALAAGRAAAVRPACLVLWEPVLEPRRELDLGLRRQLVRDMMLFGRARESMKDKLARLRNGGTLDLDGHPVSQRLYDGLAALSLQTAPPRFDGSVLVVGVSPAAAPAPALTAFAAGYPDGHATLLALREPPFWNQVGLADCPRLVEETLHWLAPRLATPASGGG